MSTAFLFIIQPAPARKPAFILGKGASQRSAEATTCAVLVK